MYNVKWSTFASPLAPLEKKNPLSLFIFGGNEFMYFIECLYLFNNFIN